MEKLTVVTLSPSKLRSVPRGKKPPKPAWMKAEIAAKKVRRKR